MSVSLPPEADDWAFEARRYALAEANTTADIREEVDAIVGFRSPAWETTDSGPGYFSKHELAMLLLALGGPQEVDG